MYVSAIIQYRYFIFVLFVRERCSNNNYSNNSFFGKRFSTAPFTRYRKTHPKCIMSRSSQSVFGLDTHPTGGCLFQYMFAYRRTNPVRFPRTEQRGTRKRINASMCAEKRVTRGEKERRGGSAGGEGGGGRTREYAGGTTERHRRGEPSVHLVAPSHGTQAQTSLCIHRRV